jgi:hypothetical protein
MKFCQECGARLINFPQHQYPLAEIYGCLICGFVYIGRLAKTKEKPHLFMLVKGIDCWNLISVYIKGLDTRLTVEIRKRAFLKSKVRKMDRTEFTKSVSTLLTLVEPPELPWELKSALMYKI